VGTWAEDSAARGQAEDVQWATMDSGGVENALMDGHERSTDWQTAVLLEVDARRGCRAKANPSSLAAVTSKPDSGGSESGFADGRVTQVTGTRQLQPHVPAALAALGPSN